MEENIVAKVILLVEGNDQLRDLYFAAFDRFGWFPGVRCVACAASDAATTAFRELIEEDQAARIVLITECGLHGDRAAGAKLITQLVDLGFIGPVIMLSSLTNDDVEEVAGRAVTFLLKPVGLRMLRDKVAALLEE